MAQCPSHVFFAKFVELASAISTPGTTPVAATDSSGVASGGARNS